MHGKNCFPRVCRYRYTICGLPLEQDWKTETQAVIVTAAGFWFTVAQLGHWLQAESSQNSQGGTPGGSGTRKAKKLLGKSKAL